MASAVVRHRSRRPPALASPWLMAPARTSIVRLNNNIRFPYTEFMLGSEQCPVSTSASAAPRPPAISSPVPRHWCAVRYLINKFSWRQSSGWTSALGPWPRRNAPHHNSLRLTVGDVTFHCYDYVKFQYSHSLFTTKFQQTTIECL